MAQLTVPRGKRGGPVVRTTDDLMTYWGERITAVAPDEEYRERSSIIMRGDRLFHYGSHFELARIVRRPNGRARMVLLNGDQFRGSGGWGPSTNARQWGVRKIVERETAGTNIVTLNVPFSALDAAGIDFDSITVLDTREDRYERTERIVSELPSDISQDDAGPYTYSHPGYRRERVVQREDGKWIVPEYRHWLADSLFKAASNEWRLRPATREEREVYLVWEEWSNRRRELDRAFTDAMRDAANAHFLKRRYDMGAAQLEDRPLPTDEEIAALDRAREEARAALNAHDELKPPHNEVLRRGKKLVVERRVRRWAKYLSSFDYNEAGRPYFLCELRYRSPANTVAEAIDDLRPDAVIAAQASGVEVLRQGDVFAIPTALTTRELKSRAELYEEPGTFRDRVAIRSREKHGKAADILDTNHRATHVIVTKDGDYYGRGYMYHDPGGWRTPDHARLKLGDGNTWYRLVKNTVPQARTGMTHRTAAVNQSGNSRAWMLGGQVD